MESDYSTEKGLDVEWMEHNFRETMRIPDFSICGCGYRVHLNTQVAINKTIKDEKYTCSLFECIFIQRKKKMCTGKETVLYIYLYKIILFTMTE